MTCGENLQYNRLHSTARGHPRTFRPLQNPLAVLQTHRFLKRPTSLGTMETKPPSGERFGDHAYARWVSNIPLHAPGLLCSPVQRISPAGGDKIDDEIRGIAVIWSRTKHQPNGRPLPVDLPHVGRIATKVRMGRHPSYVVWTGLPVRTRVRQSSRS